MVVEIRTNKMYLDGNLIAEKAGAWTMADIIKNAAENGVRGKVKITTTTGAEIDETDFPYDGDLLLEPVALAG